MAKAKFLADECTFVQTVLYPPSSHFGMIVLKMAPDPVCVRQVHETLKQLLRTEDQFEAALFTLTLQKSRMPQIEDVKGEAVVLYREPLTTQEMRYHRLSPRVNNMAFLHCFLDAT
jgi:hypothetical protein